MTRTRYGLLTVLLAGMALMLAGCGGDDNGGLSAEDMARIDAAESAAMMAQTEAEEAQDAAAAAASELAEAQEELADLQAQQAEMDDMDEEEEDTSALDEAIAALQMQIAALTTKTADPMTAMEILGGEEIDLSAADRKALATKVAGELSMTYDHDGDESLVDLTEISEPAGTQYTDSTVAATFDATGKDDAKTAPVSHASQLANSFLKHTFAKTKTTVDLSGDLHTLSLKPLLSVNDEKVKLMSFSISETDKVEPAVVERMGADTGDEAGTYEMGMIRRRADGSMVQSAPIRDAAAEPDVITGLTSIETSYVDGHKVITYSPSISAHPIAAGTTIGAPTGTNATIVAVVEGPESAAVHSAVTGAAPPAAPATVAAIRGYQAVDGAATTAAAIAGDRATAMAAYTASTGAIDQHSAMGYGAWLEDSFFAAYTLMAENDAKRDDPDETAHKIVWGGRTHESMPATSLSGRGSTAMWKGLMVGHDMDADAASFGEMVKGNAMITAHLGGATVGDTFVISDSVASLVKVELNNIINSSGKDARVTEFMWDNLDLMNAGPGGAAAVTFNKGSEVMGTFYDNGNEVVGEFDKDDMVGVFGAIEYKMPAEEMMAGN